jgi:hypothetical protein
MIWKGFKFTQFSKNFKIVNKEAGYNKRNETSSLKNRGRKVL